MTSLAMAMLFGALVIGALDWWAVHTENKSLEYVCKPGTMVLLIVAALAVEPVDTGARTWFVVALVLSMLGDIFLMSPRDLFVAGLASFLLGHIAYIVGLSAVYASSIGVVIGIALVGLAVATLGRHILGAVRTKEPDLLIPVGLYIGAISAMVIMAGGSGVPIAVVGALCFYGSDALIAWNRFVRPLAWSGVAIMVTYHLAQFALVLSLV